MSEYKGIEPTHVFLADVHLDSSKPMAKNYERNLCSLISYAADKKIHLYLLGDIFDYWMEFPSYEQKKKHNDKSVIKSKIPPIGSRLLDILHQYNKSFTPAYYILGNHDYWDAGHFTAIGCTVFKNGCKINLDQQSICLIHGDGLPTKKTQFHGNIISPLKRPIFHTILQSKIFIKLFQFFFQPHQAWSIMKYFSNFSKKKRKTALTTIHSSLKYLINFSDIDIVIAGDDHCARTVHTKGGQYINTGPYYEHHLVLTYSKQGWKHAQWDGKMNKFIVKEQPIYSS